MERIICTEIHTRVCADYLLCVLPCHGVLLIDCCGVVEYSRDEEIMPSNNNEKPLSYAELKAQALHELKGIK